MGEVWKAKDTRLDRVVAVKVLPRIFANDETLRARFEREARSISSLNHPHICTLYDVGRQEESSFLVMELLEGESLADRLDRGALPIGEVLRYGAQIADALHHAHKAGIVHRDLKPANIFLTGNGAKLLDFGLARPASGAHSTVGLTAFPTQAKPLTTEGTILGTFQYMAPEQLEGEEADGRTDIFALGALLYEMATGRRAFEGKSRTSLIAAIVSTQPPPISSLQPVASPALDHLVRRCLEKEPDDRWQSARDVAAQLRWIAEAGSQAGVAAPIAVRRKTREKLAWSAAAAAALLAAGVLALHLLEPKAETATTFAHILPPEKTVFQFSEGDAGTLTVSPDGRHITFLAKGEDGKRLLWLRPLDSGEAHPLTGTDDALFPFWSPDSRFIAFFAGGRLQKIDVMGGPPLSLCDVGQNPRRGSWNREDVIIFSPNSLDAISRVPASGGKPVPVTKLDTVKGETTHRWATFLPDGRHFLYMAGTHTAGNRSEANAVYLGDLKTSESKLLLHTRSNVEFADGHLLYVRENVLVAQPFDPDRLELSGDPVPLAEGLQYASGFFYAAFSVSRNGVLIYRTGRSADNFSLEWVDRQGKPLGSVPGLPPNPIMASYNQPSLSPDGGRLAIALQDGQTGRDDVWVLDLKRNVSTRLTFGAGDESGPCWSPDGKRILYSVLEEGALNLFMKSSDGVGDEEAVLKSKVHKVCTDWSPDGRFAAVSTFDPSANLQNDVSILGMTGGKELRKFLESQFRELEPRFSPDGRWLLYASDESGSEGLYVTAFPGPGGKYQIANDAHNDIRAYWGPGGAEIDYLSKDSDLKAVPISLRGGALEIGAPRVMFKVPATTPFWVPDREGKRILLGKLPEESQSASITLMTHWTNKLKR
jgi:eukaryotic-like serine/threonine-protein kinase